MLCDSVTAVITEFIVLLQFDEISAIWLKMYIAFFPAGAGDSKNAFPVFDRVFCQYRIEEDQTERSTIFHKNIFTRKEKSTTFLDAMCFAWGQT